MRYVNFFLYLLSLLKIQDKKIAFNLMRRFAKKSLPDYKFNFPEIEWWKDSKFLQYLNKFNELYGCNANRRWALKEFIRLVENVEGDTVECGSYLGASSYLMLESNKKSFFNKMHYIFDSFEGLSIPNDTDGNHWQKGDLSATEENLEDNLLPFKRGKDYLIYKGWIPDRFNEVDKKTFSFIHIDVDLNFPTFDSLEFFYPRLKRGGIILCDDYGFDTCPGATEAMDNFFLTQPEKPIALPDGGGLIIKGIITGKK